MTNNIQTLATRLASTRNSVYEATMNDYSMDSINRCQADFTALKLEVEAAGLTLDIAPWNNGRGQYLPAITLCRRCARNRGLSRSVNTLPTHDYHCEDCDALTNEQFQY